MWSSRTVCGCSRCQPALIEASPAFYAQHATDARAAPATVSDASDIVRRLLEGGHSTIAGRLAAAFRNIGRERIANDVVNAMKAAGHEIREQDPFENCIELNLPKRGVALTPAAFGSCGAKMREPIIANFPNAPGRPNDIEAEYLKRVDDVYVTDAYHSLSIEGYRVSVEPGKRYVRETGIPIPMIKTASMPTRWQPAATG